MHVDVRKNGGLCTETPGTTPGPALPPEPTERPILKLSFGLKILVVIQVISYLATCLSSCLGDLRYRFCRHKTPAGV